MAKEGTNGVSKLMNQLINENGYAPADKTQEWKEVDALYFNIAHSLVELLEQVKTVAEVFKQEADLVSKETIITINGINSDINAFSDDLVKIRERHKGKTGFIDPASEDMILCLSVYNDYVILSDRLKALTFPAMLTLTEAMMEIADRKKAQDPNVVTDVEVKTPVLVETTEPPTAFTEEDKDKVNV